MAQEIERKFLVRGEAYKQEAWKSVRMVQGYICSAPGRTVRVRIKGDKGYLTIKGPASPGGISRFEWEKEIALDEAEALFRLCEPGAVVKTRHLVRAGELMFEVDEFEGENEGLVMAEIELPAEDAPFVRPDWLGEEVTGDARYYNSMLSKHPFRTWREEVSSTNGHSR